MVKDEKIVWIDVDDLGIDTCNIRDGEWIVSENKELINNIKKCGILNPLTVRPTNRTDVDVKYSIVCGSRRYNAAIEVGLTEVPCRIVEMNNFEAIAISMMENKTVKDIPDEKYVKRVGQLNEMLILNGTDELERELSIMESTGLSLSQVKTYLKAYKLPDMIKELMKPADFRSVEVKELLKKMNIFDRESILTVDKANMIANRLSDQSVNKQFEVAAYVMSALSNESREKVANFIEMVKTYPKDSMRDIYSKVATIVPDKSYSAYFPSYLYNAFEEACMKRQVTKSKLILLYVEKGLKDDGYL